MMSQTFVEAFLDLYDCGALEGADVFVLCMNCDDVTEAWDCDMDQCARCGFAVPDRTPRGKYARSN